MLILIDTAITNATFVEHFPWEVLVNSYQFKNAVGTVDSENKTK